jgi:hypothetical protein
MTSSARFRKVSAEKNKNTPRRASVSPGKEMEAESGTSSSASNVTVTVKRKSSPTTARTETTAESGSVAKNVEKESNSSVETEDLDSDMDEAFEDHSSLGGRIARTLYFANKLPSTPRPSFPLTGRALYFKYNLDTIQMFCNFGIRYPLCLSYCIFYSFSGQCIYEPSPWNSGGQLGISGFGTCV